MRNLHQMVSHREGKPRALGLTHAVDTLDFVVGDELPYVFDYVDVVKIGWGLPALLEPAELFRRIAWYKAHNVEVSSGGSLGEYAILKGTWNDYAEGLERAGFDIVEISESRVNLGLAAKRKLVAAMQARSLKVAIKVGKKNPKETLGPRQLRTKVDEALALEPWRIIVEAGEGIGVTLFDALGELRTETLDALQEQAGRTAIVYEAPLRRQRGALILRLGPQVNVGGVALRDVPEVETQRLGVMSGETFGLQLAPRPLRGGPAVRFVQYLVAAHGPVGQATLARLSGLPRRTLQAALDRLVADGHVTEEPDLSDLRRRLYRVAP